MPVKVKVPAYLRKLTEGLSEVEVAAGEVSALLRQLEERFPGLEERLRDGEGRLHRSVNIFVNGENVRFLDGLSTPVKDGDEVSIIPLVAGGEP